MRLQQAIFTSVRSERLDGYQLAARSAGVSDELAKELTGWGPAHDSMWFTHPGSVSVNFHSLAKGQFCVSQTTLSGAEYSGRGGGRVYTQMIVVPAEGLARFGNDPFLVLRALAASGRLIVYDAVPREVPSINLIGRAGDALPAAISEVSGKAGSEAMGELTSAALTEAPVAVISDLPIDRLFQAMLHQLDPKQRLGATFTTGLKPSSRRPFKFSIVPDDPSLVRQSQRMHHGKVIEILTAEVSRSSSHRAAPSRGR